MSLTYNEFKKIVPEETSTFFEQLLPLIDYYIGDYNDLQIGTDFNENETIKKFFLSIYCLGNMDEYSAFLGLLGYDNSVLEVEEVKLEAKTNLEDLYNKYNYLIPNYKDKLSYYDLQPTDIVYETYLSFQRCCNDDYFNDILTRTNSTSFGEKLRNLNKEKKQIQERELEKEIYHQVPINIISYLETASKIRTILIGILSASKNDICKCLDNDIVPVSLLLALFHENTTQNQNSYNDLSAIVCLLEENDITLDKIQKTLEINISSNNLKSTPKNTYAIKELYRKYYQASSNTINMNPNSSSIQGIFKNLLNRNFSNSIVIEKILSKLNCNIEMFKNLENDMITAFENQKKNKEEQELKLFYKNVPKKTKDFIEFTARTYSVLIEKMTTKKYNENLLVDENDVAILALYITSYYFNTQIAEFFNDHGVGLEKILKLLNFDLTKEEIEQKDLDKSIIISKYKRFIYENEPVPNKLTINNICQNMCNRTMTKSMILENIFNSIATDLEIDSNFQPQLKKHFALKENKLKEKFFQDIPIETVEILEQASSIYKKILKSSKGLDSKGAQSISILLSIVSCKNNEGKEFFESLGLYDKQICYYFDLDLYSLFNTHSDINILKDEYEPLIFGLANKDKKRSELTPIAIAQNIFSKDFNNSVAISKFLDNFSLSYEDFSDFESLYQKYLYEKNKEERHAQIRHQLFDYPNETKEFIKRAVQVHKMLEISKKNGNFDDHLLTKDSDLEALTLILTSLSIPGTLYDCFERNNLTREKIFSIFKLNHDFLSSALSIENDFDLLQERYFKYLKGGYNRSNTYIKDVVTALFKENDFLERLTKLTNVDYEVLTREIETGEKYEDTLTINERMQKLNASSQEVLDVNNMESVLEFGNSLVIHSDYIHKELPKIIKNDANEQSISTISKLISEIYSKDNNTTKQQGFFSRIFSAESSENSEQTAINNEKMQELKSVIDSSVGKLKEELLNYDKIRRYIEAYSQANRMHYQVTVEAIDQINSRLTELNPYDDDNYAEYLNNSSCLQIVNDKANRFATINALMRKELLRINQAIVNHFITINSLEMARDDLIPLIETGLTIAKGNETENEALTLSKNIMNLFQALLTRNIESTVENMNKIQQASISENLITSINEDINTYLQGISKIKILEAKETIIDEQPEKNKTKEKVFPTNNQ